MMFLIVSSQKIFSVTTVATVGHQARGRHSGVKKTMKSWNLVCTEVTRKASNRDSAYLIKKGDGTKCQKASAKSARLAGTGVVRQMVTAEIDDTLALPIFTRFTGLQRGTCYKWRSDI